MKRVLFAAAVLAVAPGLALAQAEQAPSTQQTAQSDQVAQRSSVVGPVAGSQEVTLSGTGSSDNDLNDGSFGVTGSYGWFFNPNVELGLRQSLNWANVGSSDTVNGTTRVALDYHFNLGRLRPFIGANIGATYGDGVADTGIIGPEVGVKYFVNQTTFVLGQAEYQYFFDSSDEVADNFDDGAFVYTLGLGFIF